LQWITDITEYLIATGNAIRSAGGSDLSGALDPLWPMVGPSFEPPTYLHQVLREVTPDIEPDLTYLKGCYAVHWIFHDALRRCPKCHGKNLERNGWNPSGPREVHGLFREEMAIGIQLRCLDCAAKYAKNGQPGRNSEGSNGRYCWTTTSPEFWENFEHWELPSTFSLAHLSDWRERTHQCLSGPQLAFHTSSAGQPSRRNCSTSLSRCA
ncbi:hypothetical protein LXA43DRAFT_906973, partial [Ganoderma leucocontextum]